VPEFRQIVVEVHLIPKGGATSREKRRGIFSTRSLCQKREEKGRIVQALAEVARGNDDAHAQLGLKDVSSLTRKGKGKQNATAIMRPESVRRRGLQNAEENGQIKQKSSRRGVGRNH